VLPSIFGPTPFVEDALRSLETDSLRCSTPGTRGTCHRAMSPPRAASLQSLKHSSSHDHLVGLSGAARALHPWVAESGDPASGSASERGSDPQSCRSRTKVDLVRLAKTKAEMARGPYELAARTWLPTEHGQMDMRVYVNAHGIEAALLVAWPDWVVTEALEREDAADDDDGAFDAECCCSLPDCPHCQALQAQEPGDPARVYRSHRLRWRLEGDDATSRWLPPLVRIHDACATSELFGSVKCDCAAQLRVALSRASVESSIVYPGALPAPGALLYLPQEGRGIGLAAKAAAYALQRAGSDTVDANRLLGLPDDARVYDAARDALVDAGLAFVDGDKTAATGIRLLSNNPRKSSELEALGVPVLEAVPHLVVPPSKLAQGYLRTKAQRMGHTIPLTDHMDGLID
jgi:GTP cyclohydrolase II